MCKVHKLPNKYKGVYTEKHLQSSGFQKRPRTSKGVREGSRGSVKRPKIWFEINWNIFIFKCFFFYCLMLTKAGFIWLTCVFYLNILNIINSLDIKAEFSSTIALVSSILFYSFLSVLYFSQKMPTVVKDNCRCKCWTLNTSVAGKRHWAFACLI